MIKTFYNKCLNEKMEISNKSFYFNKGIFGSYFLDKWQSFVKVLKKIFMIDYLKKDLDFQQKFVDDSGIKELEYNNFGNNFNFEKYFSKMIRSKVGLQKFLNPKIRNFNFLMKLAEHKIQQTTNMFDFFARFKKDHQSKDFTNHQELYFTFQKNGKEFKQMKIRIHRTSKKLKDPEDSKEIIHISDLESVLFDSLKFGYIFSSSIFTINDSIKLFYQKLDAKKYVIEKIFKLDFQSAKFVVKKEKELFKKKEIVITNIQNDLFDEIFYNFFKISESKFKSLREFISAIQNFIKNVKKLSMKDSNRFLGNKFIFQIKYLEKVKNNSCVLIKNLNGLICYLENIKEKINLLSIFNSNVKDYFNEPIFNISIYEKILPTNSRILQDRSIINEYRFIESKNHEKKKSNNEKYLNFDLYIIIIKQVNFFIKYFVDNFSSTFFHNIKNEISFILNILKGDINLLIEYKNNINNRIIKVHPCIEAIKLKIQIQKIKIFKFMRESLKYSFKNKVLYNNNNILFFLLFFNHNFQNNYVSDVDEDLDSFFLDIFTSKPFLYFLKNSQ